MAPINKQDYVKIIVFDDGNQSYQNVHNKWMILDVMFGGDKVKLKNFHRPEMILPSISTWKVEYIKN
jgi:hypothetical protein